MSDSTLTTAGPAGPVPALGRLLGAGGEAEVYEVRGRPDEAYKRYRRASPERAVKLAVMVAHPPAQAAASGGHIAIAWPRAVMSADGKTVDGFTMPRVDLRRAVPLFQVYNPQSRARVASGFTWRYLLRTARNVAAIVASLHDAGYVIGDLNESNFLVTDRALVVLVDCDSMQVRDPDSGEVHRGAVGKPEFLAPEFQRVDLARTNRTYESDRFALGVLTFLLLMEGLHPFAGVWRGRGEPPDLAARIRRGRFPHRVSARVAGRLRPPPLGVSVGALPRDVRSLVRRTFSSGLRRPSRRPTAREWTDALEAAEARVRACARSPHHVFGAGRRCPWCARVDAGLPDPFPAPGGSGVAPRPPPWARRRARALRTAAGRALRRFGGHISARVSARVRVVTAAALVTAAGAWLVPIAGLAIAILLAPAAGGVASGGRIEQRWWRGRALLRRARLAWAGLADGLRRMHWTAAAATAGACLAVFVLHLDVWSSGRAAAASAAVTHVLLTNLRR